MGDRMTEDPTVGPGPDGQTARTPDAVDRAIIDTLRADGRIPMIDLAERVGISRGNAYLRLDRLRREGVIAGFAAVIDPRRLGLGVAAYVNLKVEQHDWREVRRRLLALPEVEHIALLAGDSDFVVLVRAPDIQALRDLVLDRLGTVTGVRSTFTTLILDEQRR
jgi:DNA-binding Lrp family transcriptional regulator